jgi:diguanylate cyclase (GGDEF)-like protein
MVGVKPISCPRLVRTRTGFVSGYRCSILVVDDEPAIRNLLGQLLSDEFDLVTADSAEAARTFLAQRPIDIVLTDQQLPGQTGVQLLEHVCLHSPQTIRIMMTGLGRLEDAVDAINCGRVHHYLFKPFKNDQLVHTMRQAAHTFLLERSHAQLLEELRRLNLELEQRVKLRTSELEEVNRQLQQKNSMLKKMALTDALTGLPNRRAIDRLARQELVRRSRYPNAMSIGMIDADNFRDINKDPQLLHTGGDHVLTWLGQTLGTAVRTVDTVGRVGGEEFIVVAPETDLEGAAALAERIRSKVEAGETVFNGVPVRITVSVGMAVAPVGAAVTYDQLRHAAAAALGEAKVGGRNRSVMRVLPGTPEEIAS